MRLDEPYHRESKWGIDVYEQGCDFILVVEYQTIPPCNDCAREGAMGKTIASRKEGWAGWKYPDVDKVENCDIIA
jgi:hypothetical protein